MTEFSIPNSRPGACEKCHGTGEHHWGGTVNGVPKKSGTCFACRGTGRQGRDDIKRNRAFNRYQMQRAMGGW